MIQIKHPYDYPTLDDYKETLAKAKAILANKLLIATRFGLCDKEILAMLKYIWVMMFWVTQAMAGSVPAGTTNPTIPGTPTEPETPPVFTGPFLLIDDTHFLLIDDTNFTQI